MSIRFGPSPIEDAVSEALRLLASGTWDRSETSLVDLKEEAGRRDKTKSLLPGAPRNERAAEQVAGESACMANTPGGGALILGAADDGTLIGTALDVEWLRHRVYELTDRTLTLDVRPVEVDGTRLLVITAPQAIEPIRWRGRVRWRVSDKCVEVDPASWHAERMIRTNFDWSAQPSHVPASEAREAAVDVARRFLLNSNDSHAFDLARQPTPELLRRLNVVTGDGFLTNAGVLAFVGRGEPGLDYIRRDIAGGDSRQRVHVGARGLLEELHEVFTHIAANNAVRHLPRGITIGQVRDLPEQAVREAVVNGLAHREWGLAQPTTIEHIGRTLRVTSPGGFFGGVTAANIITHPSQSRNRALTELFAAIRVAEREGVGVDRMVREMLRLGHRVPTIEQIEGPFVRVSLVGDAIDSSWIGWLSSLEPIELSEDVNALLLLRHVVDEGWIDANGAMPILQLNRAETVGAITRLTQGTIDNVGIVTLVAGIPDDESPAWNLSSTARDSLQSRDRDAQTTRSWPTRARIARSYARSRGRISTTELGALTGASPTNVGNVLKDLEEAGELRPSRPNRRGPGFYYLSTSNPDLGKGNRG
ncbi:ATP-binding protein [Hoyosella altamirensis]|uniref:ATP-dependent DNA helicase RecG n=1 Tax=Hoyosella altamirensis TaxID=616997 RepID=A0A839RQI4_9ACTN|nr:ATP-binding protein [Hoyosella altamirensis]MBB3038223.1 ATP-dependent DNA helicase RecG [Hoyosella altamirensis]